jgi:hypothetical protein
MSWQSETRASDAVSNVCAVCKTREQQQMMQTEGSSTSSCFCARMKRGEGGGCVCVKDVFERRRKADAFHLDDKTVWVQLCPYTLWWIPDTADSYPPAVPITQTPGLVPEQVFTPWRREKSFAQSLVIQPVASSLYQLSCPFQILTVLEMYERIINTCQVCSMFCCNCQLSPDTDRNMWRKYTHSQNIIIKPADIALFTNVCGA